MSRPDYSLGCLPALTDNYVWLIRCEATGEAAVIDPGVDGPVLNALGNVEWTLGQILLTHWHADHTAGVAGIKAATGCTVAGPAREADKIAGLDRQLREGDQVRIGNLTAEVWEVPGHTLGHIAYYFANPGMLFIGDTLFAMGCGRLFEGTAQQMHANMVRLRALPDDVIVYPAHEYTVANARFALTQKPGDPLLQRRLQEAEELRARDRSTLPTTIGLERVTNPFLMAEDAGEFARLRAAKDSFG